LITARSLLRHAIGLLTQDPLKTLTVVAPALGLMAGIGVIAALAAPDVLRIGPGNPNAAQLGLGVLPLILLGAFVLSYALMAILWHRHTLGDQRKHRPMSLSLVAGYLWRVIALAAVQLAVSLALVIPLVLSNQTGGASGASPALASILLTTFVTQLVLVWLSLRLSLILPAAAVGRPLRMAHSWRYTQALARPLWGVAAALAVMNTAFTGILTLFELTAPAHVVALELPVYILEGLLIFSVLTTLYAHQIQKKDMTLN
jgi:hypothetical protein